MNVISKRNAWSATVYRCVRFYSLLASTSRCTPYNKRAPRFCRSGRIALSATVAFAILAGFGFCEINSVPERHVAEKKRLAAKRYDGGGFVMGKTYELRGRLSGVVGSSKGATIDLQCDEGTFHLALPTLLPNTRSGAIVRILVRINPDSGALEPLSLVLDSAAAALDPDPKAPEPKPEPTPDAAPVADNKTPTQKPSVENKKPTQKPVLSVGLDAGWLDYFTRLVQHFNPRLDNDKAGRIAYNILLQSTQWQVDPFLVVAVIATESNFNPSAGSPKGAMGLTQIMPSTARGMGVTDPYNVEQNIYAGVRTIRGHLERNDTGDAWEQFSLALACYNAGSGAVRKHGGVPPYRETRNYINRVYSIYKSLHDSL